jgi:hypothetical protein
MVSRLPAGSVFWLRHGNAIPAARLPECPMPRSTPVAATSLWVTRLTATQRKPAAEGVALVGDNVQQASGGERVLVALRKRAPRREVAGIPCAEGDASRGNLALGRG